MFVLFVDSSDVIKWSDVSSIATLIKLLKWRMLKTQAVSGSWNSVFYSFKRVQTLHITFILLVFMLQVNNKFIQKKVVCQNSTTSQRGCWYPALN